MNTPESNKEDSHDEIEKNNKWPDGIRTDIIYYKDNALNYESSSDETNRPHITTSWLDRMKSNVANYKQNGPSEPCLPSVTTSNYKLPIRSISICHIQKAVLQTYIDDLVPIDAKISIDKQGVITPYTGPVDALAGYINYSSKVYIEYDGKTHMFSMLPSISEKSVIMTTCS